MRPNGVLRRRPSHYLLRPLGHVFGSDRDGTAFTQLFTNSAARHDMLREALFLATLVIGVLSLGAGVGIGGEQAAPNPPTLIDLARAYGGVEGFSIACGPRPSFEKVIGDAAVIVHGAVVAAQGRLSADEREVWTDYQFQPIQIIREGTSAPLSLPILFTARGGSVVVEGLTITHSYQEHNAQLALQVGDEAVLLGTMDNDRLMLSPIGVFMVRDGAVSSNGDLLGLSVDHESVPLEAFLTRVRDIHR